MFLAVLSLFATLRWLAPHRLTHVRDSRAYETREEVGRVLRNTWSNIESLVPAPMLGRIQEELRSAISLLVLATLRKAADNDGQSRMLVEDMFHAADANGDGELSFSEWFNWLHDEEVVRSAGGQSMQGPDFILPPSKSIGEHGRNPVIEALKQVFSHSLFSLQVLARVYNDNPHEYVSAFIAGGVMSGVLDTAITRTMLARLSPQTRELISFSLSIESASLPSVLKHQGDLTRVKQLKAPEGPIDESENLHGAKELIETIDLSSIQPLTAPPIFEEEAPNYVSMAQEVENSELTLSPNNVSSLSISRAPMASAIDVDLVFERAQSLTQEIAQLRTVIRDLDDKQANAMRLLMAKEYGKRDDILRLAMVIRATRLQHANRLPVYARHQLAVDTLQLWAPLSFQFGLSATMAELEVHSYVLLFPRSFGTFIEWYGAYKPLAKLVIELFRQDILTALKNDSIVANKIKRITIQSRLKTPSSAFKKMVKGAKSHHQLLDLAGIRIIVDENPNDAKFSENQPSEILAVYLTYRVVQSLPDWSEETSRFKDYVSNPKPSGYQSLHLSMRHVRQGLNLEVQIRSRRMHEVAEYGSASHKNYKALLLPPSKL